MKNLPVHGLKSSSPAPVIIVFSILFASPVMLYCQQVVFGVVSAKTLPMHVQGMVRVASSSSRDLQLILWSKGEQKIVRATLDRRSGSVRLEEKFLPDSVSAIFSEDVNHDGRGDLLCVGATAPDLSVFLDLENDTLVAVGSLRLPFVPTGAVFEDVSGDGKLDGLFFSKVNPGVVPVLDVGRSQMRIGRTIAADLPVGGIAPAQLNDDGIQDLVVYDWVRSELHLFYGVGSGRYLDQTTFPLNGGLSELIVTPMDANELLDFVIVAADRKGIQLWHGDGLGDFRPLSSYSTSGVIAGVQVRDFNRDGWPDLAYVDPAGLLKVVFNNGEQEMEEGPGVSGGIHPVGLILAGEGRGSAVVLDEGRNELLMFSDASAGILLVDSLSLATASEPNAMWVGDVNGDGRSDLVVAGKRSNDLEVLMSDSSGFLSAGRFIRLNGQASALGCFSASDSGAKFLLSYPEQRSISFLSFDWMSQSHTEAVIPDVGILEPLSPGISSPGRIQYFCFGAPGESETPSLSFFQQLEGTKFIERSFRLSVPDALMGVGVADIDGDSFSDVAFVSRNLTTGRYELVVACGDSSGEFSRRVFLEELPDTVITKSYLYIADVNNDSLMDLILSFPVTAKTLRVALGSMDGAFRAPERIADSLGFEARDQLQLRDIDGDGMIDIVVNDPLKGGVGYLKGAGDGTFSPWKELVVAPSIAHFGLGDFNGDGWVDISVLLRDRGVITMYDGRRIFRQ